MSSRDDSKPSPNAPVAGAAPGGGSDVSATEGAAGPRGASDAASNAPQDYGFNPRAPGGFGQFFGGALGGAGDIGGPGATTGGQFRAEGGQGAQAFGPAGGSPAFQAASGGNPGSGVRFDSAGAAPSGSPNLGLHRKVGGRRVIGAASAVRAPGFEVVKNYRVSNTVQFNDVEEFRGDAISRQYAQELLEELWGTLGLDSSRPEVMRKAEDVVCALLVIRTASPDADYDLAVMIGDREINLLSFSRLLDAREVTRRRFARAYADRLSAYIAEPENARLRSMLSTELGVKAEYVHLAFDGSTHASDISANEVAFTKALESTNLFDSQETRSKLSSGYDLMTGGFQVNKRGGAYDARR